LLAIKQVYCDENVLLGGNY